MFVVRFVYLWVILVCYDVTFCCLLILFVFACVDSVVVLIVLFSLVFRYVSLCLLFVLYITCFCDLLGDILFVALLRLFG